MCNKLKEYWLMGVQQFFLLVAFIALNLLFEKEIIMSVSDEHIHQLDDYFYRKYVDHSSNIATKLGPLENEINPKICLMNRSKLMRAHTHCESR